MVAWVRLEVQLEVYQWLIAECGFQAPRFWECCFPDILPSGLVIQRYSMSGNGQTSSRASVKELGVYCLRQVLSGFASWLIHFTGSMRTNFRGSKLAVSR